MSKSFRSLRRMGADRWRGGVGRIFGAVAKEGDCTGEDCATRAASRSGAARDFDFYVLALGCVARLLRKRRRRARPVRAGERDLASSFTGSGRNMKAASRTDVRARLPHRASRSKKRQALFPTSGWRATSGASMESAAAKARATDLRDVARAHAAVAIPPASSNLPATRPLRRSTSSAPSMKPNPRLRPA